MTGLVPKVTEADIPRKSRRIVIFADCSSSMTEESFGAMQTALNAVWPIENARLFGYSGGLFNIHEVSSPDSLRCTDAGTSFAPILRKVARLAPDIALIFSDGIPGDVDAMWRVWNRTNFPIAAHLCLPEAWLECNPDSVRIMRDLCRGGGQFTFGDSVPQLQNGVSQIMADHNSGRCASPRRLPDLSQQIASGMEQARNRAAVNNRVVELGEEIADAQHDIGELQQRQIINDTFGQMFANIDGMAAEAFNVQREQSAADKANRAAAGTALKEGLFRLAGCILGAVKGQYEQTLLDGAAARRQRPAEMAAGVQIGRVSINRDVLHRSAAIAAARSPRAPSLPSPTISPAPSRTLAALPPLRERPVVTVSSPVVVVRRRPGR